MHDGIILNPRLVDSLSHSHLLMFDLELLGSSMRTVPRLRDHAVSGWTLYPNADVMYALALKFSVNKHNKFAL